MPTAVEITEKKKSRALPVALGVLGAALVLYAGFAAWLRIDGRFPFHTTLNGRDVSLRRALDVQQTCMDGYYPNMSFRIRGDAAPYAVTPASFDFSGAGRAVSFLPSSTLAWPATLFSKTELATSDGNAIGKLARRIEAECPAFRPELWEQPENARLVYNEANDSFDIVPDADGTAIDTQKFEAALENHIRYGKGDLDLRAADVYRHAEVRSWSPVLTAEYDRLNRFLSAEVVYREGGDAVAFSAHELLPYISVDPDTLEIRYDAQSAKDDGIFDAFAEQLADAFDSPGVARDFIAHDGSTVSVKERTWRAMLDREATVDALAALTFDDLADADGPLAGELVREKAALDALTNYVEIDLSNQTLYLYTDGEQVFETPIVSGNVSQRHTTPGGAFTLTGKARNVTLRGPDYESFVRYWMPFNRGIGMHDASWRSSFGGSIYLRNGSHGCINLPRAAAETIYDIIDESYAIVCYWRSAS